MKCSLLFLFLCLVAAATAVKYEVCDSAGGRVTFVRIPACENDGNTCKVKLGKKDFIRISLESNADEEALTVDAQAKGEGYKMKHYGPSNVCSGSGISCPLKKGQVQNYQNLFSVTEKGPGSSPVMLEWKFTGRDGQVVGCVNVYVDVED